jgi:hypothetical protein
MASRIIDGAKGEFKSRLFKSEDSAAGRQDTVFELTEDTGWVLGHNDEIKMFLWAGYRLSKAD